MERSLFKHFPELLRGYGHEFLVPFQTSVTLIGGLVQPSCLFKRGAVFPLGVVGRLHMNLAKGDDVRAADDANIFAPRRPGYPKAVNFFSNGNCYTLTLVFI